MTEVDFTASDVVVLAVKGQDTAAVLTDLRAAGVTDQPIVCMQNGVDNERQALRLFPNVYGICVMLPADHLAPGVVRCGPPCSGLLDVGRYPSGLDRVCVQLAATLEAATFSSIPRGRHHELEVPQAVDEPWQRGRGRVRHEGDSTHRDRAI